MKGIISRSPARLVCVKDKEEGKPSNRVVPREYLSSLLGGQRFCSEKACRNKYYGSDADVDYGTQGNKRYSARRDI